MAEDSDQSSNAHKVDQHAHAHAHADDIDVSASMRRGLAIVSGAFAVLVVLGMLLIGFGTDVKPAVSGLLAGDFFDAKVVSVEIGPCAGTTAADAIDCDLVDARLTQGPDEGEVRSLSFSTDSLTTPDLSPGDRIVLSYVPDAEPGFEYQYADRQRRSVLLVLSLVFAICVVALGRLRGLAALGGIVISLVVILEFVLPAILEGHSPVLVAVIGSAAIAYVALYLAHGINTLTTVALLGTLAALALTVLLSAIFTALCHFSGYASEESVVLGQLAAGVDINGLILGGIVIGALGALDDVTVTQASAVAELRAVNPEMSHTTLYRSGIRIGRDHIASTVNTLALAYAGAALPLLLLFVLSQQSLGAVANSEVIATEIVRTLVGSIGLVAAVPITTWLAARVVATQHTRPTRRRMPGAPAPADDDRNGGDGDTSGDSDDGDDGDERSFWG